MEFERVFKAGTREYSDYGRAVPAPCLRGVFSLERVPERAQICITAAGFYDLYLNGVRITKGILAPYIGNPDHFVVYDTYKIAPLLRKGKNAVGIVLGNGFANAFGGFVWDFDKAPFRSAPKTAFRIEADGETVFSSRSALKTAPSPVLSDDLREGEVYDARREIDGWTEPGFDDSGWADAIDVPAPAGQCIAADFEPIAEYKRRHAVGIYPADDGYIYDFGVNTAGIPVLKIDGRRGQEVTLVCGEWLRGGRMDTQNIQCYNRMVRGLPDNQRIVYYCKGEKGEGFAPCFSYYGFRYVKVTGVLPEQVTDDLVVMSEQSSAFGKTGSFFCSDQIANRTFENTLRSDFSNFYYFPTDCPHREKNGWTGDVYLSAEQFMLLLDCGRSLRRWLACIRAAQKENGAVPCIVPTGGWGYGWGSGPSWDGVLTAVPYLLYRYGGDISVLSENADAIWRYLGFLKEIRNEKGFIAYGLGDWCQIGAKNDADTWTPNSVTDTCSAIDICDKAAQIFGVLGRTEQSTAARELAASLREAARANFIDWNNGSTAFCRTQTAQALLLRRCVFREEERERAFSSLLEIIAGDEEHMRVGVIGVQALLRVLCEGGMADLAYEMAMSPDRPSFGDQLRHGATSLWEFIHIHERGSDRVAVGRLKSMNHHFWGDISAWFMTYLAGIRINEQFVDPACVDIEPFFVERLDYAQARHTMPLGEVVSSWQRTEAGIVLFVRLPEGAHGTLRLHGGWTCGGDLRLTPGGNRFVLTRTNA